MSFPWQRHLLTILHLTKLDPPIPKLSCGMKARWGIQTHNLPLLITCALETGWWQNGRRVQVQVSILQQL